MLTLQYKLNFLLPFYDILLEEINRKFLKNDVNKKC